MAIRKSKEEHRVLTPDLEIPTPVRDGYEHVQSLGRFVDDLMRHSRDGEEGGALRVDGQPGDSDGDPEPITPPEPVPQGDDIGTRGADPETLESK